MDVGLFVKAFGGLFAIMNPFVNLPLFLSLTATYDAKRQRATAIRIALYSLVFGLVMIFAGTLILQFFGIAVDDFRIAGGIVLMSIALGMLHGASSAHAGTAHEQAQQKADAAEQDIAFYPLTFPIIMGPGTITTLIVFAGAPGVAAHVALVAALLIVLATIFVVLYFAAAIGHRMSATLRTIMTRLMGMILAAIAVSMIVAGVQGLLPALR